MANCGFEIEPNFVPILWVSQTGLNSGFISMYRYMGDNWFSGKITQYFLLVIAPIYGISLKITFARLKQEDSVFYYIHSFNLTEIAQIPISVTAIYSLFNSGVPSGFR